MFVLAGQSNMVGRGTPFDAELDAEHPLIFQFGRGGEREGMIVPARARLDHNDSASPERVGPGLAFAKAYVAAQSNPRRVLLVPVARGGTGFRGGHWNAGDAVYEDAIERANRAMESVPGSRLIAVLWHQGENDVVERMPAASYQQALDALIVGFRTRVVGAEQSAFVLGEFCPDWLVEQQSRQALLGVIHATPLRLPRTAVARATGLRGQPNDSVHFNAVSLRTLGARYHEALRPLLP